MSTKIALENALQDILWNDKGEDFAEKANKVIEQVKQLQAELERHRWIPVSERLPDIKGLYLVLWHNINDGITQERTCNEYIFDKDDTWGFTHWKPIILPAQGSIRNDR